MATLTCKQCGHANEEARIYCHNCGTKLDRSLLVEEEQPAQVSPKDRERVRRMMNPSRYPLSSWIRLIAGSVTSGAIAASIICAATPPVSAPPPPKHGELPDAPPIAMELERLRELSTPQKVRLPEQVINAYLLQVLKPNQPSSLWDKIVFVRAYVTTEEGVCRVNFQQSIMGYSFYAGSAYKLEAVNNKLQATNVGGSIGQLPLHPILMQYVGKYAFEPLWLPLSREHKLVEDVQSIEVHKGAIVLTTNPARR